MNYDKIILELMSRVQVLEEKVTDVQSELKSLKDEVDEDLLEEDSGVAGDFTRSKARDKAMKMIQSKFPDCFVEKASRLEGSGIKIMKPDVGAKRAVIIKFYHSKTYEHRSGYEHAWHTINLEEIIGSIYDYCLFSVVDKNGNWNFFLYEADELGEYRDENRSADSNQLHLYFVVEDGKATEVREKTVNVTDHLNNWDVIK